MFENINKKVKEFMDKLHTKGVPIPLVRDNDHASLSATLVWISVAMVVVGLIGKWSGKLGGIDVDNALQFMYASYALHFGKSFKGKNGSQIAPEIKKDE